MLNLKPPTNSRLPGIEREPAVVVRPPQLFLTASVSGRTTWDVHPDGDRFLVVLPGQASAGSEESDERYLVVLNWFEELKQRVGE